MAMTSEPIRFTDGAGYDRFMGSGVALPGRSFSTGSAQAQASVGWMWAVAIAPSPN
jgi:hypothetical protein